MSTAEELRDPGYRHERSFHRLTWRESSLTVRTGMVLDAFGIFVLILCTLALFGSGMTGDDSIASWLVRFCITALNGAVLMLATARVLDFVDKLATRNDPAAGPHALRRSADLLSAGHPNTTTHPNAPVVPEAMADMADLPSGIVYNRPWRRHAPPASDQIDESDDTDAGALPHRDENSDGTPPNRLH